MINSLKFLPNDFTTLRTPFTNFLHQICFSKIQATVLHYNIQVFCIKFFSFAFYNINFWFKISKVCPKISHFSQISHSRGNAGYMPSLHTLFYVFLNSSFPTSLVLYLHVIIFIVLWLLSFWAILIYMLFILHYYLADWIMMNRHHTN